MLGDKVISQIVQNNIDFNTKSRFTQEKFVRHKQKKHAARLRILKPSMKLISTQLLSRDQKASNMEIQQLASVINYANIGANSNVLMVESTAGLLTGAIMGKCFCLWYISHRFLSNCMKKLISGKFLVIL